MEDRYLFKAKRIDNGEWAIGYYAVIGQRNVIIEKCAENYYCPDTCESRHGNKIHEVNSKTICQFTGLKDKNGNLIWENDIVDGHIKRGAAFLNCLVLWNESKARFDVRAKGCNFPMTLDEVAGDISVCGLDYEVVGNRFDNPELVGERGIT